MKPARLVTALVCAGLLTAGCGGENGSLEPPPTTGTIGGQTTNAASGAALAGATVTTEPATSTVQSDAQGNYSITNVAAGAYTVTAANAGYSNGSANATVTAGQTSTANLALNPLPTTGTISGRVTDASSGAALDGATVTTQPPTSTVATDAQGNYSISNVAPGPYTVSAAKTGYNAGSTGVVVTAGQTSTGNLALTPLGAAIYEGRWTGTTSQGLPIEFRVNHTGQVDSLTIRLRMTFPTFSCTATFPATPPIAIANESFDAFVSVPITNVSTYVHATFSSPSTATGSWDEFTQNWFITCGSTLGFGTGGTSLAQGTWAAQKQ